MPTADMSAVATDEALVMQQEAVKATNAVVRCCHTWKPVLTALHRDIELNRLHTMLRTALFVQVRLYVHLRPQLCHHTVLNISIMRCLQPDAS